MNCGRGGGGDRSPRLITPVEASPTQRSDRRTSTAQGPHRDPPPPPRPLRSAPPGPHRRCAGPSGPPEGRPRSDSRSYVPRHSTSRASSLLRCGSRAFRPRAGRVGPARRALRRGRAPPVPGRRGRSRPAASGPATPITTSTSPPTPGRRRDPPAVDGWADVAVDPGRGVRHDRCRGAAAPTARRGTTRSPRFAPRCTTTTRASRW